MCRPAFSSREADLGSQKKESLRKRILKKIEKSPKYLWASERARKMRERSLSKWVGPLCLPMLLVIQPFADYNLRSSLVLLLLSFLLWTQYKHRWVTPLRLLRRRSLEKHCEKCQQQLLSQFKVDDRLHTGVGICGVRRLPWRLLSRHWGKLTHAELPAWVAFMFIWLYAKTFSCKVEEAERNRLRDYASLGDFFSRRLKAGARPVCPKSELVSPADGTVTWRGKFTGGFLQQVKGVNYSLNYFLGLRQEQERIHAACDDASSLLLNEDTVMYQWVIYLSPGDYHRFHSPAEWKVLLRRHFPGELLSVKPSMASSFPGLFHLNERVCWLGQWQHGFFSMTAVGATNVGSIHSSFDPDLKTNQAISLRRECVMATGCSRRNFYYNEKVFPEPIVMTKGQEFGHFEFGSTIVLLFEAPKNFSFHSTANSDGIGDSRVIVGKGLSI